MYIRSISTEDEMYIPVDIKTTEIHGMGIPTDNDWAWALLTPMDTPDHYQLTTTKLLPVPQMRFLVDIKRGISERIE